MRSSQNEEVQSTALTLRRGQYVSRDNVLNKLSHHWLTADIQKQVTESAGPDSFNKHTRTRKRRVQYTSRMEENKAILLTIAHFHFTTFRRYSSLLRECCASKLPNS